MSTSDTSSSSSRYINDVLESELQDTQNQHSYQIRFFYKPVLCAHCSDYIWGEGHIGYGCLKCSECVHSKCKIFTSISKCANNDQTTLDSNTRPNPCQVENWSINNVKEWLSVVNLHRYAEVFAAYNIDGSKLLTLDIYQLYAFRIRDTYHHSAIIQARNELVFKSHKYSSYQQMLLDQEEAKSNLRTNQYKPEHHHFLVHTLSKSIDCDMCKRPLLGILHQCLMCQNCGLTTHRQCSFLGLPQCKPKNTNKHFIFGVSLFDLIDPDQQAPLILVKAFKTIEERALSNNEDLYDVYRLSADTSKIEQIKQQINENGLELTSFESYDLNTIAALVKTFLRDLQDSVIPEFIYEKLVNNIQTCSSEDLRSMLNNNLNPINLNCLKFIMCHLIRVWNHQHKVRGCHYLPDKLFHIFRSILLRPPWEKITMCVYNIENQTLTLQRIMLEYDWGVELPEYKIRPKRPANYPDNQIYNQTLSKSLKNSNQDSINENQWYWGSINRDDTFLILKNCADGSFIVRESTDKSNYSPYTLCVLKSNQVKSIKIFKQEQAAKGGYFYDIEKPCRFDSVAALIAYYSRVSLKEYNHNLDIVLTYGVSKYKFGKTTEWSIDKLYTSFRDAFQEYEQLTKKYEGLEAEVNNVRDDLHQKKLASEAFEKIIQMYTQQIEQVDKVISENMIKKNNAISSTRLLATQIMPLTMSGLNNNLINESEIHRLDELMKSNREKLKNRVNELNLKKENLGTDIDYLGKVVTQLQEELDLLRPELIEIRKKRENYHMWLVQRGENDENIQSKLKNLSNFDFNNSFEQKEQSSYIPPEESENLSPHSNSLNWYIPDCDREKAIEILKEKPDGTYLVRPNSKPNSKYILSLVTQGEIKHILIEENQSGCFIKSSSTNQRRLPLSNTRSKDSEDSYSRSQSLSSSEYCLSPSRPSEIVKFKTLTELVYHYSKNQILTNQIVLDTLLTYPAFYNVKI